MFLLFMTLNSPKIEAVWFSEKVSNNQGFFFLRGPSRCAWSTIYYISAVLTQHIVALLQLVTFATCFGRYPAIIRPTRNSVIKGLSTGFSIGKTSWMYLNNTISWQLVTFGYMFRPLPAIIRPTRNSVVKVHSTSISNWKKPVECTLITLFLVGLMMAG